MNKSTIQKSVLERILGIQIYHYKLKRHKYYLHNRSCQRTLRMMVGWTSEEIEKIKRYIEQNGK